MTGSRTPLLSICIATFNRGKFIGETLDSIVSQLNADTEVVIVDGASTDDTPRVLERYCQKSAAVRYHPEPSNSGIDADYDKAVHYARGRYCWLMTDDDLLVPGAIDIVLQIIDGNVDLVVVNAEIRNADLSRQLQPSFISLEGERTYGADRIEALFIEAGKYLSFIGCVVVRRALWLARRMEPYYGSLFVHVGALFQPPAIASAKIVREPLIVVRYGNAMWTPRGFEIWMFKWPALIWSFENLPAQTRRSVSEPFPYRSPKRLFWYRAIGGYSSDEYGKLLRTRFSGPSRWLPLLVAHVPARLANAICGAYYWIRWNKPALMQIYDLARSKNATSLTRALARSRGLQ